MVGNFQPLFWPLTPHPGVLESEKSDQFVSDCSILTASTYLHSMGALLSPLVRLSASSIVLIVCPFTCNTTNSHLAPEWQIHISANMLNSPKVNRCTLYHKPGLCIYRNQIGTQDWFAVILKVWCGWIWRKKITSSSVSSKSFPLLHQVRRGGGTPDFR